MLLSVAHKLFCEDLKVVIYLIVNQIEESFMHSYLDMSMMIVISTAVVLLLFILVSFILTSHRCSVLEKENAKLKATAEEVLKSLQINMKNRYRLLKERLKYLKVLFSI